MYIQYVYIYMHIHSHIACSIDITSGFPQPIFSKKKKPKNKIKTNKSGTEKATSLGV